MIIKKIISKWEGDALHNLKTIAGYNNCDSSSENSMMNCLRNLDQYDLLKYSHKEGVTQWHIASLMSVTNVRLTLEKRNYRYINDGDFVNKPYMEMIKNSANAALLGGINDGDSVSFSPDWLRKVSLWKVNHHIEKVIECCRCSLTDNTFVIPF